MFFKKPQIEILASHQSDFSLIPGENLLFFLQNGKSKLKQVWYALSSDTGPYEMGYSALTLDDTPLVYVQSSGCPTCECLLAAGYGMPEDNGEVRKAAQNLCQPFTTLEDALERVEPVIGLLMTGAYILSASDYFPTDGDGNFFWHVLNDYTAVPATAQIYDSRNHRCLPGFPCYLYPSQPMAKHNAERVEYYRSKIRAGERLPHALAYSLGGFMSVLLDGHHRACACALEGINLPCLTISPANYSMNAAGRIHAMHWPVGDTTVVSTQTFPQLDALKMTVHGERVRRSFAPKAGNIFSACPSPDYSQLVRHYPVCAEAGALALYPYTSITADGIHDLANDTENDETQSAVYLLAYMSRQKGVNRKALALPFTLRGYDGALRQEAFKILSTVKNDTDIEDFFVDYLVNFDDRTDPLWKIADRYLDTR